MNLFEGIADHARTRATAPALQGQGLELSWAMLQQRLETLAQQLAGVRRLALFGDNHPCWLLLDLAARRAGACVIPIPPFFTQAQAAHVLQSAQVDAVWSLDKSLDALSSSGFVAALELDGHGFVARRPSGASALPADTAKLTFTSGSTGAPKGVALRQSAMEAVVASLQSVLALGAGHRHLCVLPLAVLLENLAGADLTLWSGGVVLAPSLRELGVQGSSHVDGAALCASIRRHRAHSLILTPQLLQALTAAMREADCVFPELQFVAVGGAPLSPLLLQQAQACGLPVYEGYGLSETSSVAALNTPQQQRRGSVGRLLPHLQCRIDGARSQIYLSGPSLCSGYLAPDGAFAPVAAELASGDQGRLDEDGFLFVSGRLKHQFITAFGRNVAPEWVESELTVEPEIQQAIVVGEAQPFNLALLAAAPGASEEDLNAAVRRANNRLPDYAQVRRWLLSPEPFTLANGLWSGAGKPRRLEIERRFADLFAAALASEQGRQGARHEIE